MKNFQLAVPWSRVSRVSRSKVSSSPAVAGTIGWNPKSTTQDAAAASRRAKNASSIATPAGARTKSTMVVVPPHAAAIVPEKKSSAVRVAPLATRCSRWVCVSMPPGSRYLPVTSTRRTPAGGAVSGAMTATMRDPSTSTSARTRPSLLTTVPPCRMKVSMSLGSFSGLSVH